MTHKLEFLELNRNLLRDTLEYLKKITQLKLIVVEDRYSISVFLLEKNLPIDILQIGENFKKSGAQMKFTRDKVDTLKIRKIRTKVIGIGDRKYSEIVETISTTLVSKDILLQIIIPFLKEIEKD